MKIGVFQLIISQHNPINDIHRILVHMRQRWNQQDVGVKLIGAINYPSPVPRVGRNPTVSIYTLPQHLQKIANILPQKSHRSIHSIMEYQKDCWEDILTSNEPLIICAPTGLGKTEAFLPPLIDRVITKNSLGILIYPRRELITDQLSRILEMYKNIQNTYGTPLKVGIQFEGISSNIRNTLLYNHQKNNNPFNRIKDINDLLNRYRGNIRKIPPNENESRNKIVSMRMINECCDEVLINLPRLSVCPVCGNGYIRAEAWYNPASGTTSRGYQLRGGFNKVTDFRCTNSHCSTVYELSLSKEDHINKNTHLLITTVESLEILLMDPNFSRWFKDRLEFLVFDEIHVYHSIYGAHVANIVRRIKSIRDDTKLIGVSATIDDPQNFGQKFFDASDIKVISPSLRDIRQLGHHEYYYFIRSRLNAAPLSVYIQTAMFLGHSLIPRGKKMLFFFDSRDLVYRARNQLIDAENNELWRFRVEPSQISFNNNNCQGPYSNCHDNCPIFASGECWYALSNILNLQHMPISSALKDQDIEGVTAMGREYNPNARIINTTSVLELGLDDPNVIFIGQYKAPHTVYSFLQRKGRGGRTPNDDVHIFMILGNDTSDLFYFKRAESIISQPYTLPLEPDNPSIKYIHDLLQLITDRILNCVNTTTSTSRNINERCAWEIMLNHILCNNFKIFLGRTFELTLSASNILPQRISLCTIVQNSIQNKKKRINQILAQYNVSTSPIQALQNHIQKLTTMSSQLPHNVQNLVTKLVNEFNNLIISLSQQDQRGISNSTKSIVNTCAQILPMLLGHPLYNEVLKILNNIPLIAGQLPQHTYEVEKLRYEIESLLELCKSTTWGLEGALNSTSPNRIVKYLLRSWYFYCKACKIDNRGCPNHGQSGGVRYPMNICPLIAYFDQPVNLILDVGGRTHTITDIDALFNYIPYKTIVEAEGTRPYIISVKPPVNVQSIRPLPTGVWQFDITSSYFEGRGWIYENEIVITPEIIHAERFDLDPQAETLVKFCEKCFNYYDFNLDTCPVDGNRLRTVRLYVEPLIERSFKVHRENRISNYLSIAELAGYHKLSQLDVDVLRYFWDQNSRRWVPGRRGVSNPMRLRGRYSTPIVFSTTTKGILLKLSRDFVNNILDNETRKYLAHKNNSPEEVVYHTIAHVLLLLVSSTAGVNPEILWYGWKSKEGMIAVWERYEGGSGICETFKEILQKDPARVYEELKKIVECPVHKAEETLIKVNLKNPQNPFPPGTLEYTELQNLVNTNPNLKLQIWRELSNIIFSRQNIERYNSQEIIIDIAKRLDINEDEVVNNFPSCIDGCPFCIGVPYCTSGKDEQYTNISLKVVKKFVEYLECITTNPDDAVKAILRGGKIVKYDGSEYTIFFL